MSDEQKKKQLFESIDKSYDRMNEHEKEKLLAFSQGINMVINSREENENGKIHSSNH